MKIIGREKEQLKLQAIYNSKKPELVVVKGRRRVGKTYLINNTFNNNFSFKYTGISPIDLNENKESKLKQQIDSFYISLLKYGYKGNKPTSWLEAFYCLEVLLETKRSDERMVVFIDELPWLDTHKSNFISSFENFWNNWGSTNENLMLIVCGSSNSWINDNLLNNYGGLYDRVTKIIDLSPFSLQETKEYFEYNNIVFSNYDIVQSYMIFGGIPFYLDLLNPALSLVQNVNELFFNKNAILKNEFNQLFRSAFKNPEEVKKIVLSLSKNRLGLTKKEISKETKISDGGTLTSFLQSLIASNIIIKYTPFDKNKNEHYYKLIDQFCLFYIHFVKDNNSLDNTFWQDNITSQNVVSWRGFSFENVCFYHIDKIKDVLRIAGLTTNISAFNYSGGDDESGSQIDLLIVRKDNIVDVCEIKFYGLPYSVTQNDINKIKERELLISNKISKKYAIHHILIASYGVKKNEYSNYFQNIITIDDLLK